MAEKTEEDAVIYQGRERAVAEVLEVDNSNILQIGVVSSGDTRMMSFLMVLVLFVHFNYQGRYYFL